MQNLLKIFLLIVTFIFVMVTFYIYFLHKYFSIFEYYNQNFMENELTIKENWNHLNLHLNIKEIKTEKYLLKNIHIYIKPLDSIIHRNKTINKIIIEDFLYINQKKKSLNEQKKIYKNIRINEVYIKNIKNINLKGHIYNIDINKDNIKAEYTLGNNIKGLFKKENKIYKISGNTEVQNLLPILPNNIKNIVKNNIKNKKITYNFKYENDLVWYTISNIYTKQNILNHNFKDIKTDGKYSVKSKNLEGNIVTEYLGNHDIEYNYNFGKSNLEIKSSGLIDILFIKKQFKNLKIIKNIKGKDNNYNFAINIDFIRNTTEAKGNISSKNIDFNFPEPFKKNKNNIFFKYSSNDKKNQLFIENKPYYILYKEEDNIINKIYISNKSPNPKSHLIYEINGDFNDIEIEKWKNILTSKEDQNQSNVESNILNSLYLKLFLNNTIYKNLQFSKTKTHLNTIKNKINIEGEELKFLNNFSSEILEDKTKNVFYPKNISLKFKNIIYKGQKLKNFRAKIKKDFFYYNGILKFDFLNNTFNTYFSETNKHYLLKEKDNNINLNSILKEHNVIEYENSKLSYNIKINKNKKIDTKNINGTFTLSIKNLELNLKNNKDYFLKTLNLLNIENIKNIPLQNENMYQFKNIKLEGKIENGIVRIKNINLKNQNIDLELSIEVNLILKEYTINYQTTLPITQQGTFLLLIAGFSPQIAGGYYILDKVIGNNINEQLKQSNTIKGKY